MTVDARDAGALLARLHDTTPEAAVIGYVTAREDSALVLEAV